MDRSHGKDQKGPQCGLFGCHFAILFSLSGFLSPGRCPIEFTGDRCQHFAMVSFSSMSLSTSLSPWLL